MKNLLFALCTFYFLNCNAEGCNRSAVLLGNYFGRAPTVGTIGPLYFPKFSTYTITAFGNFPCAYSLRSVKIYLNNILIVSLDTSNCYKKDFVLGAYPGSYRIAIMIESILQPDNWSFEIIDNPVGLKDLGKEKFITVSPNPAQNFITIQSNKEITKLSLYSISGALVSELSPATQSIELPLEEYPPGIYFLHVAVLENQPIIKKIVVTH